MKVVIAARAVLPYHPYGGMERYLYSLAKYLVRYGVDAEILTPPTEKSKGELEIYDGIKYRFLKPRVISGPLRAPVEYYMLSRNIARYLRKVEFDIFHGIGWLPFEYLRKEKGKTVVIQAFGNEACKSKRLIGKVYNKPFIELYKYCMKKADAIASEGEIQTNEIMQFYDVNKDKIFVLHDGVDLTEIYEYIANSKLTRADIGLSDNDFVLISVNRLDPTKRTPVIISAFNIIRKEINNAKLILIGAGSEEDRIKYLINDFGLSNDILHFKNVEDRLLYNYLSLSDVFVSASFTNCLSALEGIACGLPIVSANNEEGALREGENGYIAHLGSAEEIAKYVIEMHDKGNWKIMGKRSKEVAKNYDWEKIAKDAIVEYEMLLR